MPPSTLHRSRVEDPETASGATCVVAPRRKGGASRPGGPRPLGLFWRRKRVPTGPRRRLPGPRSARAQPLPPRKSSAFAFLSLELRVSRGPPSGNSNKGDDAAHACHAFDLLGPGVVVARRGLSSQLRPQGERQTPERRGGRPEGRRGAEEGPGTRSWGAGSPGSGGERVWGGRSCRTSSPAASAPRPAAELSRSSSVGSPSGSLAPRAFGHRLQQGLAGEQPLPRISALLSTQ